MQRFAVGATLQHSHSRQALVCHSLTSSCASTSGRQCFGDFGHIPTVWRRARLAGRVAAPPSRPCRAQAQTQRAPVDVAAPPFLLTDCSAPPTAQDIQDILPHLTPRQLADAVWSFAKHDVKPAPELMEAIAQEIHSKVGQFRSQDLSNTLWALAMLKYQPSPSWWMDFERQVYQNVAEFNDRELSNLLWAFAVLGQHSSWIMHALLAFSADNFVHYSATSLHLMVWSLGKLSYTPSEAWMSGFLKQAQNNFFKFTPTELANIIWALAKLGVELPAMWLDNFLMVAQWRFPSFGARLLSILVWSAATLNHRPQQDWLVCFEEQVRQKFQDFSGHELACVAWSLRKFGYNTENNAVFYLLEKQQQFLRSDFDILSNSKLLRQVLGWKGGPALASGASGSFDGGDSSSSGWAGGAPPSAPPS